jgi:hypothetical protein
MEIIYIGQGNDAALKREELACHPMHSWTGLFHIIHIMSYQAPNGSYGESTALYFKYFCFGLIMW